MFGFLSGLSGLFGGLGGGLGGILGIIPIYGVLFVINLVIQLVSGQLNLDTLFGGGETAM
ncbi:MAG: hypothetical protein DCC65_13015 [Planctomycetota bacterium]|nr:MAG: hypothetical protein DCC65_13015 [Planctomycetota bacterium]